MDISNITAFTGYNVQIKAGDCNIRKEDWNRNDFPFWKYFEEATNAECLNNWKAKGSDISEWSDYAQKGAKSIADSQITIIMPESLKQKMEADSDFASKIMKKVSDWKTNYDSADMAIGMAHGESYSQAKMALQTGSYLIELDENGDVENYTVTTHGTEYFAASDDKQVKKIGYDNLVHTRNTINDLLYGEKMKPNGRTETEPDYMEAMAVLSAGMRRV